jgi:hypothetical protein
MFGALFLIASSVVYIGGTWHAFVAYGVGAGFASMLLGIPSIYYFFRMLAG